MNTESFHTLLRKRRFRPIHLSPTDENSERFLNQKRLPPKLESKVDLKRPKRSHLNLKKLKTTTQELSLENSRHSTVKAEHDSATSLTPIDNYFLLKCSKGDSPEREFPKNMVRKAKLICKKCKSRLALAPGKKVSIYRGMFLENPNKKKLYETSRFKIFNETSQLKACTLNLKEIIMTKMGGTARPDPELDGRLTRLKELGGLLVKFLMNEDISLEEIRNLSAPERQLLLLFVNKKKRSGFRVTELTVETARDLRRGWVKKRFEENLRFVVNKAFKFLRKVFNDHLFHHLEKHLGPATAQFKFDQKFEYCFYGYYFQEASASICRPIEFYFHPKSKKYLEQNRHLVPKPISQHYLNLVCTSPAFKRDFRLYLALCIQAEVRHNLISKVGSLCRRWEAMEAAHGWGVLLKEVTFQFESNPKCKVPWGVQEVLSACDDLGKIVNLSN